MPKASRESARHIPLATAGSELVQFSPSEELHLVEAAMRNNMREMKGA